MKRTLIVIDMQNDFITGSLGTPEAQAIVPNVKRKIEEYESRGDEVIFTRDTHYDDYLNTNEGKHLPVEHCIWKTDGWKIYNELDAHRYLIIDKEMFGFDFWYDYVDRDVDSVELVGLVTEICVISNALILKAQFPEINITVDASCCAGTTPEKHRAALEVMKSCQINVVGE